MKKRLFALCALLALTGVPTLAPLPGALAHPEPALVSPSWNLEFAYSTPRGIAVRDPAGHLRWYWYMPYKVVNHTGADQLFIPEFTVYTDTGAIIQANQNVPADVYPAIKEQLGNPLLETPMQVAGRLLQGEDYARESVAIWPAFEGDVDEFTLFVGGLSGESKATQNPLTGEEEILRRTTMLRFKTPGNYPTPQGQPIQLVEQRDVMR